MRGTKKRSIKVTDFVLLGGSAVFFLGMLTVFRPCEAMEDGGWMSCHWAGQAVTGVAALLLGIAILHLILADDRIKMGLSIAVIPAALLAAAIPGHLISLCMMDTMRCRAVMAPGVTVLAILVAAAAVWDIVSRSRR